MHNAFAMASLIHDHLRCVCVCVWVSFTCESLIKCCIHVWTLQDGDIINIDVTVYLNVSCLLLRVSQSFTRFTLWCLLYWSLQGYNGDTSATFFCGDVDEKAKKLVQVQSVLWKLWFIIIVWWEFYDFECGVGDKGVSRQSDINMWSWSKVQENRQNHSVRDWFPLSN